MEGKLNKGDNFAVWGYMGGYVNDIKIKNGLTDGFSTQYGTISNAKELFKGANDFNFSGEAAKGYYSDPISVDTLKIDDDEYANQTGEIRDLDTAAKKLILTASIIGNDVVENEGLSEETKQLFTNAGYTGSFGADFGIGFTHKNPNGLDPKPNHDIPDVFTQGDVIAQLSSLISGTAIYGDSVGYREVTGINPSTDKNRAPVTMEQFEEAMTNGLQVPSSGLVFAGASKGDQQQKDEDARALTTAFFNIAKNIPDDVINNADIKVRHYVRAQDDTIIDTVKWNLPWLIDFKASAIPSVDTLLPEPESQIDDQGIKEVRDNGDGTYTLIRNNGDEVDSIIDTSGNVSKIKPDGKGNLIVTIDGKDQTVPLDKVKITESNKGKKNHTITITTPDGASVVLDAYDNYVTDVKKDKDGNYTITRNDGKSWTINLADLNKRIGDLENKDTVSPDELKAVQDDLGKAEKDIAELKSKDTATDKTLDGLRKDVSTLQPRVTSLEKRVSNLEKSGIKEVKDNGDGTYTLIRNDGTKVKGDIDTAGNVTNIKSDGKGNLVVTIDGKDQTVPLDQVKITESNKDKKDHTVTITTPDGKSVTFNVFDVYVTNVEKQADGNYKVTRNDGESWVINLKDIRDQIAALEAKDSPTRQEFNQVKKNIDTLKKDVDGLKTADKAIKSDIANIKTDITNLDNRITKVEARLTVVEDDTAAITKCIAGAGMAGIPTLLAIPLLMLTQVNIPGIRNLNTQIQQQIGVYDENLAQQWEQNGGVLQAGAIIAGLAGMIGSIAYIADQCGPTMKTPTGQATDLGQLSSKLDGSGKVATKKEVTAQ